MSEPVWKRLCRMSHRDLNVCPTDASVSLASFKNSSISFSVLFVLKAFRVFLDPPLMTSLSSVFILVTFAISLLVTFAHMSTPTFATFVGPASLTQLLTSKFLWLYKVELAVNMVWNIRAPRLKEVITWEPYLFKNTSYCFQEFANHGFSNINGKRSKSSTRFFFKVDICSLSKQSFFTKTFSLNAWTFKEIPLTLDSCEPTLCTTLLSVAPRAKKDISEPPKPAPRAIFE